MPTATGRAFTTANFLANLAALKAINFGSSDPNGTWFIVPNQTTNNVEIWVWEPASTATTNEIDVVRPDSIVSNTPGRCIQRLKFDASSLGGILAAIATLNTAGLIERTAGGSAAIVGLGAFGRSFLGSTTDSGARTTLGLDQINNTSDANKPVSTAQLTALNLKANLASPTFTGTPLVPTATAGTNTTQAASTAFVASGLALKANLASPTFTGTVSGINATMVGLGNVTNTSDANKPVSAIQQTALDLKANLISPTFTGVPAVPTATAGTNTTQAASTAFVGTAIAALVNSSPAVLDTLGELATALGNDPNFATTITNSLGLKAPLASPTFTGTVTVANALILPSTVGAAVGMVWRNGNNLEFKDSVNATQILLNSSGNLSNLSDKQVALNTLVGTQTANRVLRSNGTNMLLAQVNLSTDVTGNLPAANGGITTTTQTITGTKTFSSPITVIGDVGILNLLGQTDNFNTFRFTASINTPSSYWDFGVLPSSSNRDFYIGCGYLGGVIALKINSIDSTLTLFSTVQSTSTTTGAQVIAGGQAVGGNQYVGGFSSLGDNNTGIKCKIINFTSPIDSTLTLVTNLLPPMEKIVQITGMIQSSSTDHFGPNHYGGSFYGNTKLWSVYPYTTGAYVILHPDAVATMGNRPGKLIVTYIS